jgi:hypothetical protein
LTDLEKINPDTCAVSDLQALIASGKKFRTIASPPSGLWQKTLRVHLLSSVFIIFFSNFSPIFPIA